MNRTRVQRFFAVILFAVVALTATSCGTGSTPSSGENPPAIAATIHIADGKFEPREIDVAVDGSVTWINDDVASHNVKFLEPSKFNSGIIKPAATWIQTFTSAGTYDYYCDFHNSMKGSVVVRPAP
jgi:plastocyanin